MFVLRNRQPSGENITGFWEKFLIFFDNLMFCFIFATTNR